MPEDKIIGVVIFRIPKLGWIKIWLSETPGLSLVLILGLSILLVVSLVNDVKDSKEKEEDQQDDEFSDEKNEEESLEIHHNFTSSEKSSEAHAIDPASDPPNGSFTNSDI